MPVPGYPESFSDMIHLKNSDAKQGRVMSVTEEGVQYRPAGLSGTITEPNENVSQLDLYDRPYGILKGDEALQANHPDEAVRWYQKALDAIRRGQARPLHLQFALHGIARARERGKNWNASFEAYLRLLDEVRDTRFKAEAYRKAGMCALRLKDRAQLKALAARIDQEPRRTRPLEIADLARAWLLYLDRRPGEAGTIFSRRIRDDDPGVRIEARLGVIECLSAEKRDNDLRQFCEETIRNGDDSPRLAAAACNALGDVAFARAQTSPDARRFKEALLHYLRTVILYAPPDGGPIEAYTKALYRSAQCFTALERFQPAADKREYRNRAQALRDELKRDYPNSAWASLKAP
jgi:tetratricopeptide (TPR) repeat protein